MSLHRFALATASQKGTMTNSGSTEPTQSIPVRHWPDMLRGKLRILNLLQVLCFMTLSGRRTEASYVMLLRMIGRGTGTYN